VHPDFFASAPAAEQAAVAASSTSLNVAYRALRDPVQRAQHLLELQGLDAVGEGRGSGGVSPALLEQVMAAREAVGDAGTPLAELRALRARAAAAVARCEADLCAAFDAGDGARAREITVALSYYAKLEEEAGEEEERREASAPPAR
jgi:molecular chaperone HscB